MVNINLVPEKIRSTENLRLIVMVGAISLVLPALFWGYRYQGKRSELAQAEQEVKALNAELNSDALRNVVTEVEQFTKDQGDLTIKRSVVDQLRKRQVLLLKLLDMLPDIVPGTARIKRLAVTDVKGAKQVELGCDFNAKDGVATVYENLEASSLVGSLQLTTNPTVAALDPATGSNLITATYTFTLQDEP
jgi:Tfp pilus assembly protein PilN